MRNRTLRNIQAFRELLEILSGGEKPMLDIRPVGTPIGPAPHGEQGMFERKLEDVNRGKS